MCLRYNAWHSFSGVERGSTHYTCHFKTNRPERNYFRHPGQNCTSCMQWNKHNSIIYLQHPGRISP